MNKDNNFSNNTNQSGNQTDVKNYIGMPYNGDCNIYKRGVLIALFKAKVEYNIKTSVMEADSDLSIAKILIRHKLYNILLDEFHYMDVLVCMDAYIDDLTDEVLADLEKRIERIKKENSAAILDAFSRHTTDPYVEELIRKEIDLAKNKCSFINSELAEKINEELDIAYRRKLKEIDDEIARLTLKKAELKFFEGF